MAQLPMIVEHDRQRVLTTAQVAESYGTSEKRISENFNANQNRYMEGKHFYCLKGEELKKFLRSGISGLQNTSKIRMLYLWTEKGLLFHAKSLNNDKAWEAYEFLVDHYFKAHQIQTIPDSYMIDDPVKRAERWIEEQNEKQVLQATVNIQSQRIQEMRPKEIFADATATSKTSILIGDLAKILKQNGVQIGANRLFEWMRQNGYLISRKGTDWNMPTQKSMELRLFEVKETVVMHSDGHCTINKTPKVTGKGQVYFINKFLKR